MLIGNLKVAIQNIKGNPFGFIFSYIVLPLILATMLFKSQAGLMSGEIEISPISLSIVDEDKTAYSDLIGKSFVEGESSKYFIVKEDGEYLVKIAKGFGDGIAKDGRVDLKVESNGNSPSIYQMDFIKSYLDMLSKELLKGRDREEILSALETEAERSEVFQKLLMIDSGIDIEQENILKEEKISFNEYNGITMIQYIFIMFLLSATVGSKKLKETTGLPMRIETLPVDRFKLNVSELISSSLVIFVSAAIYISISRLIDMGFSKDYFLNILSALVVSLSVGSFAQFLLGINDTLASVVTYGILYGQLIFGGLIGPVNKLFENTVLENFLGFNLNSIFIDPFMDLGNEIFSIKSLYPAIGLGLVSFVGMYIVIKWKEKKVA